MDKKDNLLDGPAEKLGLEVEDTSLPNEKFADFGTRKKMSKEWHKEITEIFLTDQGHKLLKEFTAWLQTDSGEQAIVDSGGHMNDTLSPLRCADAFAMASRSFIAGWLLAKEDLVNFLTEDK